MIDMAYKRRLVVEHRDEPVDDQSNPEELGWKDWLLRRYARPWYWVGCIFLDIVIFFELQWALHVDALVSFPLTVLVILIEAYLYIRVWGRGGPLAITDPTEDDE